MEKPNMDVGFKLFRLYKAKQIEEQKGVVPLVLILKFPGVLKINFPASVN